MPIIRSPSNCRCSLWFPYECEGGSVLSRGPLTNRPRVRTLPSPHSYGNQRLQRQFDGLLMMDIIMAETCWAVSVRQSNKILRLIVASSWVFYLSDWRCTEPQILKTSLYLSNGQFSWKFGPKLCNHFLFSSVTSSYPILCFSYHTNIRRTELFHLRRCSLFLFTSRKR